MHTVCFKTIYLLTAAYYSLILKTEDHELTDPVQGKIKFNQQNPKQEFGYNFCWAQ